DLLHDGGGSFRIRSSLLAQLFGVAAEIVFEVVDTPLGVVLGVHLFMAKTAFEACAGLCSWRGVDAELQAFAMNIVGERLHVWEFFVGMNVPLGVACAFPRVVD